MGVGICMDIVIQIGIDRGINVVIRIGIYTDIDIQPYLCSALFWITLYPATCQYLANNLANVGNVLATSPTDRLRAASWSSSAARRRTGVGPLVGLIRGGRSLRREARYGTPRTLLC